MIKWAAVTFGVGMMIILLEWNMARKKKGGVSWTDKQRMIGIFWVSCAMSGLVAGLIFLS